MALSKEHEKNMIAIEHQSKREYQLLQDALTQLKNEKENERQQHIKHKESLQNE